jgi:hypothetical protein
MFFSKEIIFRSKITIIIESVPKLIDCVLTRTVLDQPFVVSQAFSLRNKNSTKLRFFISINKYPLEDIFQNNDSCHAKAPFSPQSNTAGKTGGLFW